MERMGVRVKLARTLKQARAALAGAEKPEFLLLDRTLPDGDGIDLCRELRDRGFGGTVLMLTARGATQDRVAGLDAGADDYLPKPFSWEEFAARIKALARRAARSSPVPAENRGEDSLWTLEEPRLRVLGPGGWITLTPLEFRLARTLIEAEGGILGRSELLKKVWGFTLIPKTRTVDHFMGRLRKHFELDCEAPKHFLTVRGAGYRFQR